MVVWFNVDFPGYNRNYTFAVIYRHPWNNHSESFEVLDKNMHKRNCDRINTLIFGDMNINLNSDKNASPLVDLPPLISEQCFHFLNR